MYILASEVLLLPNELWLFRRVLFWDCLSTELALRGLFTWTLAAFLAAMANFWALIAPKALLLFLSPTLIELSTLSPSLRRRLFAKEVTLPPEVLAAVGAYLI